MALDTYENLKSAVASWLHRADLTTVIPDFITLAETRMSEMLEAKGMQATTTLATVADTAFVDLPTDFKQVKRLNLTADPTRNLKYASPDELTTSFPYDTTAQPALYSIVGDQIQLSPVPDAVYSLDMLYTQRIPALSASLSSNWLLVRSPNAYLFGALAEAMPYLVNDGRAATFEAKFLAAMDDINLTDWHSGGAMRVRAG
jgi:hypothetical protein